MVGLHAVGIAFSGAVGIGLFQSSGQIIAMGELLPNFWRAKEGFLIWIRRPRRSHSGLSVCWTSDILSHEIARRDGVRASSQRLAH